MANGYPVQKAREQGQRPSRPSKRPKPVPIYKKPANDNWRLPANDNTKSLAGVSKKAISRGIVLKLLPKIVPIIGTALTIYDIVKFFSGFHSPKGYNMTGWNKIHGIHFYKVIYGDYAAINAFREETRSDPYPGTYYGWKLNSQSFCTGCDPAVVPQDYFTLNPNAVGVSFRETFRRNGPDNSPTTIYQHRIRDGYRRDTVASAPTPAYDTAQFPNNRRVGNQQPSPLEIPQWVDPFTQPIGEPIHTPAPPPYRVIPYRQPNPYRSPHEQPIRGPFRVPRPAPRTRPLPRPGPYTRPVWPAPAPRPGVTPFPPPVVPLVPPTIVIGTPPGLGVAPGVEPGPSATPTPNPGPQVRTAPRNNEQERKIRVKRGKIIQALALGSGFATEFLDFSNVLYDALPKSCKPGYYRLHGKGGKTFYKRRWRPNQTQRHKALVKCWAEMDMQKAVEGLVKNQLEDAGIGFIGKTARDAFAASGSTRPLGLQAGPWDTIAQDHMKKYNHDEQMRRDKARRAKEQHEKQVRQYLRKSKAIAKGNLRKQRAVTAAKKAKARAEAREMRRLAYIAGLQAKNALRRRRR